MGRYTGNFKGKLKGYFIQRLGAFEYKHQWLKMDCPECGRSLKYGVNIGLNRTNCFVCGYSKKPIDVIMDLEHLNTYSEAVTFINNNTNLEGYEYRDEKVELRESKPMYLPEGFRNLSYGDSLISRGARSYIRGRGFDVKLLARRGWGYGTMGKYFGYIIIPFMSKNQLTYFNARLFMGSGPRYNNPETDISGLGKSFIWYNHDAMAMYKTIYICEGVFNAEIIGDRAMASGGKFVSRYQINELIKSPVERVIICLDRDAIEKAIDLAAKLIDFKKIKIIIFPEGKDANDIGHKATMRLVYNSRYLSKMDLNMMKRNL